MNIDRSEIWRLIVDMSACRVTQLDYQSSNYSLCCLMDIIAEKKRLAALRIISFPVSKPLGPPNVVLHSTYSLEVVLVGDAKLAQVQALQPSLEHEQLLAVGLLPLGLGEVGEPVLGLVQRLLVHVEPPLAELRVDRRAHAVHLALLHLEHEVPVHVVGKLAVLKMG